jgi:nucleoside-diphosphate-sugar epimerase
MSITITGAGGFLGQRVTKIMAERGESLVLADLVAPPNPPAAAKVLTGDLIANLEQAITPETTAVFHLAAVVSAGAEADFELGYNVNLTGLIAVLERCRTLGQVPKFMFTSSLAAFGALDVIDDTTATTPQGSYGTQKAIGELLVQDYSRKGYIDGATLRLPTVVIRPGKPNAAASGFASGILREPLAGIPAVCPVSEEVAMLLASPKTVTSAMIHAFDMPPQALAPWRTVNVPGITSTVGEMVEALGRAGGDTSLLTFKRDPVIEPLILSWPGRSETPRAFELGFSPAEDLDSLIQSHIKGE